MYMHVGEAAKTHVLEKKPGLAKNISELKGEAGTVDAYERTQNPSPQPRARTKRIGSIKGGDAHTKCT